MLLQYYGTTNRYKRCRVGLKIVSQLEPVLLSHFLQFLSDNSLSRKLVLIQYDFAKMIRWIVLITRLVYLIITR